LLAATLAVVMLFRKRSTDHTDTSVGQLAADQAEGTETQLMKEVEATETKLLNSAVQEMWPEITSFIETVLKDSVEDAIRARLPWFLTSLGFGRTSFGDAAVQLEELKMERINQVSEKDGLVRDLHVTGLIVWDADVDVALHAVGANLVAEHVAVKGQLAVCLKQILPRPPFFTGIRVYFTDQPSVGLALRLVVQQFSRSYRLGWVEDYLADIIQQQLGAQLVLPNVATVLLDTCNEEAWFQVGGVLPDGVLTVQVQGAHELAAKDWGLPFGLSSASSDPYCMLTLGGKSWRTVTKPQTLNPVWTEEEGVHSFLVHSAREQSLQVQLFDENPYFPDVFLGKTVLGVREIVEEVELRSELLGKDAQGSLSLRCEWAELVLDPENTLVQLRRRSSRGCLSRASSAFVLFVGVDSCVLREEKLPGTYFCEVECEDREEELQMRAQRAKGYYGASAWWRRQTSETEAAGMEEEDGESRARRLEMELGEDANVGAEANAKAQEVNFQATVTHLLTGDPYQARVHLKLVHRSPPGVLQSTVGTMEFPVSRLFTATRNTERVAMSLEGGVGDLSVIMQLRTSRPTGTGVARAGLGEDGSVFPVLNKLPTEIVLHNLPVNTPTSQLESAFCMCSDPGLRGDKPLGLHPAA